MAVNEGGNEGGNGEKRAMDGELMWVDGILSSEVFVFGGSCLQLIMSNGWSFLSCLGKRAVLSMYICLRAIKTSHIFFLILVTHDFPPLFLADCLSKPLSNIDYDRSSTSSGYAFVVNRYCPSSLRTIQLSISNPLDACKGQSRHSLSL